MRRCGEPMDANGMTYLCRRRLGEGVDAVTIEHVHAICGDAEHRHGSTPCTVFGDRAEDSGAMLDAVRGDLAGVDIKALPGGRTYQAMAFWLAGVIDKRGEDDGPSTTAKLSVELGKVMAQLTKGAGEKGGDGFDAWADDASTPTAG